VDSIVSAWAHAELRTASLGDARRTERAITILAQRASAPNATLAQTAGTDADTEATYRFFANDAVMPAALLAAHQRRTQERLADADEPIILAVQDTTQLDFSHHPDIEGIGVVNNEHRPGLLVHTTLAVTPQRVPLGLLDQQMWTRSAETLGKRPHHDTRPIGDKESHKWITSLDVTAKVQAHLPKTRLVSVGDREADIYDLFLRAQMLQQDVLVRGSWDRRVAHPEGHLWAHLLACPTAGEVTISTPRQDEKPSRSVTLTVRFKPVTLRPPKKRKTEHLPEITVWAILASEENAPAGTPPIQWLLLTTVATITFEQACVRIGWYSCRWVAEMYHKVLKSGCRVERRQFDALDNLTRYLTMDSLVAWWVLYLTMVGRKTPDIPCTVLFEDNEWQALYGFVYETRKLPPQVPTLGQAILWIAKLGGYTDRRHNAHPGTTVIWRGLSRLYDIANAWRVFSILSLDRSDDC
jgi:hypothetical protein